jgi:poly(3-hydroxybutyrate) depolymerase
MPNQLNYNALSSGGESRQYVVRWPESYDSSHPYRLILGFHGATGDAGEVARNSVYFGLYELSEGSAIFIATEAVGGLWSIERDLVYVDDILAEVLSDLCIDTSRIQLEGFSQGGAMVRRLACDRPNVFSAAVAHSAGGLTAPESCEPIPYLGSLGLQENGGQETQSDFFATANGCTVESLPSPPSGGHLCTDYSDCAAGYPVRWCPYDGGHTPSPSDSGQTSSWMPEEVWAFFNQF